MVMSRRTAGRQACTVQCSAYQRVGDGGGRRVEEDEAAVLHGVGGEPQRRRDEQHGVQRHVEQRQARRPPQGLAQVRRRRQAVERLLGDAQRRLERRRVGREVEVGPRQRLDPHRRHQHRPPPPRLVDDVPIAAAPTTTTATTTTCVHLPSSRQRHVRLCVMLLVARGARGASLSFLGCSLALLLPIMNVPNRQVDPSCCLSLYIYILYTCPMQLPPFIPCNNHLGAPNEILFAMNEIATAM